METLIGDEGEGPAGEKGDELKQLKKALKIGQRGGGEGGEVLEERVEGKEIGADGMAEGEGGRIPLIGSEDS